MFDIGSWELLVVVVVGLLVIGPKELPAAIRTVRGVVVKLRGMAQEFRSGVDDVVREAELSDLKDQIASAVDPGEFADLEHSIRGEVWSPDEIGAAGDALADSFDLSAGSGDDAAATARRRRIDALTEAPDETGAAARPDAEPAAAAPEAAPDAAPKPGA